MHPALFPGIFLVSACILALEIVMTRILSVVLSYHYVFIVVSVAVLGLGIGSISVYFISQMKPSFQKIHTMPSLTAGLFALSIPLTAASMTLASNAAALRNSILIHCLLLAVPFIFAGAFLAGIFRTFPEISPRIYGADLTGAAAGALATIPLLEVLGGLDSCFLLGLTAAAAALVISKALSERKRHVKVFSGLIVILTACILAANLSLSFLKDTPIGLNPDKQSHVALGTAKFGGETVETQWSAYGRTDLVKYKSLPDVMVVYIDGTAGSPMLRFDGNLSRPSATIRGLKTASPGYFPFFFLKKEEKEDALIIGPGGGRDILLALMAGVGEITAVEINRDLVSLVKRHSGFNGGIYSDFDNVEVVVDEGRNFLRRQEKKYDLIMLQFPYTESSRSLEGYMLTESFLFTTDSFEDYLEHLTREGRLVVGCDRHEEAVRLVSLSLAVFSKKGMSVETAMKHIYVLASKKKKNLFVLKKNPFNPQDMRQRYGMMQKLRYAPASSYIPYIRADFYPGFSALAGGNLSAKDFVRSFKEKDVSVGPVTDNSPFFFKFRPGIPGPVSQILWISAAMLLLVIVLPFPFLKYVPFLGSSSRARTAPPVKEAVPFMLLFTMLGSGFMLAEISLIQKFSFILGRPVLSLTVLLFSLLTGAGLGSLSSGRIPAAEIPRAISRASILVCGILLLYAFFLPVLFSRLMGSGPALRAAAAGMLSGTAGYLMGFPFPLGIKRLKDLRSESVIPWMWGINGICSVLGSGLILVIAIHLGFAQSLACAAGCYFTVFLLFSLPSQRISVHSRTDNP